MNPSPTNSLDHFLEKLFGRIDYERNVPDSAKNFDLSKMQSLMQWLGNPEIEYPVIHVAGTKGKGSVSVMAGAILSAAGRKTGVYTSPHMETIHQRLAIDGELITDDQLRKCFGAIDGPIEAFDADQLAAGNRPISFFEYTTALAFTFFALEKCQAAVIEVGLGGRLDSTNVCQPAICIITNISLDHTRILGDTVEKIAAEKGGIIKRGVPVVNGAIDFPSAGVIQAIATERGCRLFERERDFSLQGSSTGNGSRFEMSSETAPAMSIDGLTLKMPGQHQRENAALAVAAINLLPKEGWEISAAAIRTGLRTAKLPGRIEIVGQRPTVLMDMAHNPASAAALVQLLKHELPAWQSAAVKTLVFGTTRDKDCKKMLKLLLPLFDRVVFTKYKNNPRGMRPEKLKALSDTMFGELGNPPQVDLIADPVKAWETVLDAAQSAEQHFVCIAGSAFLIAEVRSSVLLHVEDQASKS